MLEVRDAVPGDAHAIAVVHVVSWQAAYRGLLPDDVLAGLSVPVRERRLQDELSAPQPRRGLVVVADETGVLGFARTGPEPDDPATGRLFAFYLHPDAWGRGVGSRLHAGALDRLRSAGFTGARLWVLEGNERAVRFYRRHGWEPTGRAQVEPGPDGVELRERELAHSLRC